MRRAIAIGIVAIAAVVVCIACQPYGPNNPPRMRDNPELQGLRNSRQGGLPNRCASCHGPATTAVGAVRADVR